jgi:hypothetical protein
MPVACFPNDYTLENGLLRNVNFTRFDDVTQSNISTAVTTSI